MNILKLIIKQKFFDEILNGTKTQEFREVRPTTFKKYLRYVVNGETFESLDDVPDEEPFTAALENDGFDVDIVKYDAIQFYVGYNANRDSALVEVKDAIIEYFVDENNEPIYYEYKDNEYIACQMVYELGNVLEKNVHPKD